MHSCYRGGGGIIWILHKNGDEEGALCDVTTTTPTEIVRYRGGRARRSEPCRLPATRLGSGRRAGSHKSAHIYSQPWVEGATSPPFTLLKSTHSHSSPLGISCRGSWGWGVDKQRHPPLMHPTCWEEAQHCGAKAATPARLGSVNPCTKSCHLSEKNDLLLLLLFLKEIV